MKLADYVEHPADGPPVIRNRLFRNALLEGPIVLYIKSGEFRRVAWGVALGDPETMFWELPNNATKIGAAVVENVVLEDCETEHVAIAGTREMLDDFRQRVEAS